MPSFARRMALLAAVALPIVSVAKEAFVARAPDVVRRKVELRGPAAARLAELFGLRADEKERSMPLSLAAEHRAMPERDAALRDDRGLLPSDLSWRASRLAFVKVARPDPSALTLEGWFEDRSTALPAPPGPRFAFTSPLFSESEVGALPTWKPLYERLAPLPATPRPGQSDWLVRSLEVPLDGAERATAELHAFKTWNAQNQPVDKRMIVVALGHAAVRAPSAAPPSAAPPGAAPSSAGPSSAGPRRGCF